MSDDTTRQHQKIEQHLHRHQVRVAAAVKQLGPVSVEALVTHTGLTIESVDKALIILDALGIVEDRESGAVYVPANERPPLPSFGEHRHP